MDDTEADIRMKSQPGDPTPEQEIERSFAGTVREIQGSALTQKEIARIVRANPRTVQNWSAGITKPNADARDRLLELKFICDRLRSFLAVDAIEIFWHSRSQWLDEERPIDLLERGEFDLVRRTISAMRNLDY